MKSKPISICFCEGMDEEYENQVSMKTPDGKWVCIDFCIATAIAFLWKKGVKTLNSCCGHNGKAPATVIVAPESIAKMRELGYRNWESKKLANPERTFVL